MLSRGKSDLMVAYTSINEKQSHVHVSGHKKGGGVSEWGNGSRGIFYTVSYNTFNLDARDPSFIAEREARRIILLPDSGPRRYNYIYICLSRMWVGLLPGAL